jgi:protein-tyrosine-phosphatase/catechol 2,3-dioxygenase-like lactoylglutathione lyase family enzyme
VSLNVASVAGSIDFYRAFFGVEPVKVRPDYAKFDLVDPPLNLTMNQRPPSQDGEHGRLSHLGIQVDGHEGVEAARQRLIAAGLLALDEEDTVCCYARQDKVWATDPDGNHWEVFFVMEADVASGSFTGDACGEPVEEAKSEACCTPAAKDEAVAAGKGLLRVKTVLFACVHNTGRSQMAEAFFNRLADPAKARAISGGTEPATEMNATVLAVMSELGIDLVAEGHRPKIADLDRLRGGDRPISMGCGVSLACPLRLGQMEDWGLDDPKGQPIEAVRAIRDDIRGRVARLVDELGAVQGS